MKVLSFLVLSFRAEKIEIEYEFDDEIDLTILSNFTDESLIREIRVHENEECCHTYAFNEAGLQIDASNWLFKNTLVEFWKTASELFHKKTT